ncbi:MAG: HAD family phosphatase [Bacteroidota bacterium]
MEKISTIILDLGGVILNLDQELTFQNFSKLGFDLEKLNDESTLFNDFEKGFINETDFRSGLKKLIEENVSDEKINEAWNSMLLDLPEERIELIKQLKLNYEVYLLSNTNSIHISWFNNYFENSFENEKWEMLFNRIFYSHEIGFRKPNADIYEFILNEIGKTAKECIFIDDNKLNLEGAESIGIRTIWAKQPLSKTTLAEIKMISDAVAERM